MALNLHFRMIRDHLPVGFGYGFGWFWEDVREMREDAPTRNYAVRLREEA